MDVADSTMANVRNIDIADLKNKVGKLFEPADIKQSVNAITVDQIRDLVAESMGAAPKQLPELKVMVANLKTENDELKTKVKAPGINSVTAQVQSTDIAPTTAPFNKRQRPDADDSVKKPEPKRVASASACKRGLITLLDD